MNKIIQKKQQYLHSYSNNGNSPTAPYDPEIYAKLKKAAGLSTEESIKTL